jgi:ABC-type multidrug transport system fused ATPase/permease subunit
LQRESYTGRDLYDEASPTLNLKGGTLSVDDSVLDKPYVQYMALVGHFWSGKHHRGVKGVNLVTLYYTDSQGKHQPVNFRVVDKAEGKTKNGYFQDMLAEVLEWGLEPASERFNGSVAMVFSTARQRLKARALLAAFTIFIVFAAIMTIIWLGTRFVMTGQLRVGELSQFLIYAIKVATNSAALSEVWGDMQRAAGALERILQLLKRQSGLRLAEHLLSISSSTVEHVHFDKVFFHYPS